MPFNYQNIALHTRSRDASLVLCSIILFLDILTIPLLCITIGLFFRWAPWHELRYSDWSDALMLGVLLISLTWSLVIILRPAWTSRQLHPGYFVAWELISWLFVFGSVLSALLGSELLDMLDVDEQINNCSGWENDDSDPWRCEPRIMSLQKLQIAAYSFAPAIS